MVLLLRELNNLWGPPTEEMSYDLSQEIGLVCTDSRTFVQGNFFVPLVGKSFDGHNFLEEALKLGAQAAIISKDRSHLRPNGLLCWIVRDTLEAYQQLALLHRRQFKAPFIAITGSSGKTTTRALVSSVLSSLGEICSSKENNNNDVGVPLTLLKVNAKHKAVVVEMGMRGLGEIDRLSLCTQPDVAVITNIGTAHIGRLGSRKNIAKAKCEITNHLNPAGLVVIPAGDPLLEEVLANSWEGRVMRVAIQGDCQAEGDNLSKYGMGSLQSADLIGDFYAKENLIRVGGNTFKLPLQGIHNACNFMLALAVAQELKVRVSPDQDFSLDIPRGRNTRLTIGGINVLDETYNASPESVKASLDQLVTEPGRHFLVLGTMLELGSKSLILHREVVKYAISLGLDGLVIVSSGEEALVMAKEARSLKYLAVVDSPGQALAPLKQWLKRGDVLLLKASRSIKLERLLELLLNCYC